MWHLLLFIFKYDFTLEEGGIERSEETNEQEVSNRLARESLKACATMAGLFSEKNTLILEILHSLLTPYVTSKLVAEKPEEVRLFNRKLLQFTMLWLSDFEDLKLEQCHALFNLE